MADYQVKICLNLVPFTCTDKSAGESNNQCYQARLASKLAAEEGDQEEEEKVWFV